MREKKSTHRDTKDSGKNDRNKFSQSPDISKLVIIVSFVFLMLIPAAIADNTYRPYLHEASVPDHPKVKLYGSYSTDLFPGAATYTYPIEVPEGTNGLKPSLSISYNSQTIEHRPGILGTGWKTTQNFVYRDVNSTPDDTSDDSFKLILDGVSYDLVYVSSDGFYHTKIESFMRIQNLTGANNTYSSYWLITLKDGTKYRFGYNTDSELTSNTGRNYALQWSLDQIEDTHGNKIFYFYLENPNPEDKGAVYLSTIQYNNDRQRAIQFSYETSPRTDMRTVYDQGNVLLESRRLTGINVSANGALVRRYSFEYTDLNPEKSLSSLSKIKFFGSDGTSMLHQVSFEYYGSSPGFTQNNQVASPTSFSDDLNDYGVRLIDVNRDGYVDIVKGRQLIGENKVWINNKGNGWIDASSTWSLPTWITKTSPDKFYLTDWQEFAYIGRYSYGMVSFTCPNTTGSQKVDGCDWSLDYKCYDTWGGYQSSSSIDAGQQYIMCYYGDQAVTLYSMCCRGDVVHNCDGTPIDCCEKGKVVRVFMNGCWQDTCQGVLGDGWFYPYAGGVSWCERKWAYKPYKTNIESDNGVRFVDINNDGFVDIIQGIDGVRKAWINNGTGWVDVSNTWAPPIDFVTASKDQGIELVDFNGDGRVDILQAVNNSGTVVKRAFMNSGTGWVDVSSKWQSLAVFMQDNKDTGTRIEDVNNDGLPDILSASDTTRGAWLNTGSNWTDASSVWTPPATFVTSTNPDNGARFIDVNGDGLVDIVEDYANGTTTARGAWINNGHGWIFNSSWQSPEPFTKDGKNIGRRIADVNGDGLADILVAQTNSSGSSTWTWLRNQDTPFMLKKIVNELGGSTSINYNQSASFNNTGSDSLSDIGFNVWVVGNVTQNNSMTGAFNAIGTSSYAYSNGFYNYPNFEFRGFGKVNETLPDNSLTVHYFYQDDARKGKEYRTEIYDSSGKLFSTEDNNFDSTSKNGYFVVKLNSLMDYLFDGSSSNPVTKKVSYSYDSFGNVIEKMYHGDINVLGDEKDEKYSFVINTSVWIVNAPTEYQLFASDNTTKMSDIMYSYDGNAFGAGVTKGDVTQVQKWINPSTGQNQIMKYDYDSFGNVIHITDPLGRTDTYMYGTRDPTYTHIDSYSNALSQRTDYKYVLGTGNLLWSNVAGLNTSYEYDIFGRVTKEVESPDTSSAPTKNYSYIFDGITPEIIKVSSFASPANAYDNYYYYDGFGNLVQMKSPSDGNKQILQNFFYDSMGKVISIQNPYFESFSTALSTPASGALTSYTYDPLGRVILVLNPDGTNKTIAFNHGTITAYDENGHRKSYTLDAYDRITKVTEYNSDPLNNKNYESDAYGTTYIYDASDNLVRIVDNAGNVYSFVYDSLGRRTSMSDPDLGLINYTYDLAGNLVAEKQQNSGNLITGDNYYREYNALNQLIRIRNGSTSTSSIIANYTYDPYGQRIKTEMNDTAKTKIYTPFNEFTRIVNSTGTYDYTYVYQDGVLVARVNPDGSKFYYQPDSLGSTSLITDKNGGVIQKTFYSPYGETIAGGTIDSKLYTGQIKDFSCSYYYRSRYYNPCNGQFMQPDSQIGQLFNPQSLNRYSYASNNPYKYVDTTGHQFFSPQMFTSLVSITEAAVSYFAPVITNFFVQTVAPAFNTFVSQILPDAIAQFNTITAQISQKEIGAPIFPSSVGPKNPFSIPSVDIGQAAQNGIKTITNVGGNNPKLQDASTKIDTIINDHVKPSDLEGARKELRGEPILKSSGEPYQHVKEIQDADRGLSNRIKELSDLKKDPTVDKETKILADQAIEKAKATRELIAKVLAGG